jgi:hypothetical protein
VRTKPDIDSEMKAMLNKDDKEIELLKERESEVAPLKVQLEVMKVSIYRVFLTQKFSECLLEGFFM